jgi:peptidoglycan/xylan/chitin deacetylase (PgdA/CDA1 family)
MFSVGRRWDRILVLFMVLLIRGIRASDEDIPKPVTSIFPDSAAITSFSPGGQYIMLTFDSTPHSKHTDKILDGLRSKNATATFFVYGTKSFYHAQLIQRLVELFSGSIEASLLLRLSLL